MENNGIYLPGGNLQLKRLEKKLTPEGFTILVVGPFTVKIADRLSELAGKPVDIIVEDYDSLMSTRLMLKDNKHINVTLMDYEITDFPDDRFDLIYTQGAVSTDRRNKIIKEFRRILKPSGYFYVGEIVDLTREVPPFVLDIYENSGLLPLHTDEIEDYYRHRNFDVEYSEDLSATLRDFYSFSLKSLDNVEELEDNEKSYYKKLINRISHESKAYLKQGADKHIGYKVLLLKWTGI